VSAFTVRLATGTEYWYSDHRSVVGETIVHLGRTYVVTRVEEQDRDLRVVTVEEVMQPEQASVRPARQRYAGRL
jgi:hypothetical protein